MKTEARSQKTVLKGHIYAKRKLGGLLFLVLRNREGLQQVVFDRADLVSELEGLSHEAAVELEASWRENPEKPGEMELEGRSLKSLSAARSVLPVEISKEKRMESLSLNALLEYRPLTLRNEASSGPALTSLKPSLSASACSSTLRSMGWLSSRPGS